MSFDEIGAGDPRTLYDAFGDPREYDRFDFSRLQIVDYAVIVNARPGAIYFFRTRDRHEPADVFEGDVVMTHLLLGENATRGEAILRRFVGDRYSLEHREGPDMDGVHVPFYVLKELAKKEEESD